MTVLLICSSMGIFIHILLECKDNRTDCAKWKYLCEVKGYKPHMEKSCPLTCGACSK